MDRNYHTMLATKDICILASLLNKDFIVGVKNHGFDADMVSQPEIVQYLIHSLEQRSLIHYEWDGTLLIDPRIRIVIDLISNPQKISIVREQGQRATRTNKFLYFGNETTVELRQDTLMDHYDISVYQADMSGSFFEQLEKAYLAEKCSVAKESVRLEELLLAKEYIQDFHEDKGFQYISNMVKNQSSIEVILNILREQGESVIVRTYEREGFRLSLDESVILVKLNDISVKLSCDDNKVVNIEIYEM